jgi:hypothetical protein
MLAQGSDPGVASRAALGALRCAMKLGKEEDGEIEAVAAYWSTLTGGGDHLASVISLCRALARQGRKWPAVTLARAEAEREGKARALYLLGRCLEIAGDGDGAFVAFGRAVEKADKEPGAADVALASRAFRVERMLGDRSTAPLAVAEAAAADPAGASPGGKLVIALGRLRSASRFVRASGLSLLEELGRDPGTSLGRLAIQFAAEHADAFGDALTPLEADRIAATLGHVSDEKAREDALGRLRAAQAIASSQGEPQAAAIVRAGDLAPEIFPLVCRARAVVTGGGQGGYTSKGEGASEARPAPAERVASLGLDAVVALGRGRVREAVAALVEASELVSGTGACAPVVWTAARIALEGSEPLAREGGVRLAEALLASTSVPPLRGYASVAPALQRAGRADLAARAARAALGAKEAGARELLGVILRDEAWALAGRGQRDVAILLLREAKEHLGAASAEGKGRGPRS